MRRLALALVLMLCAGTAHAFTPTDIPTLLMWLKADAGVFSDAGLTPAVNNGAAQQWSDQSGSGNNCTQASAPARPTFKTAIIGSQPVVRFDGAASVMSCPSVYPIGPYTLIVIAVQRGVSTGNLVSGVSGHALYYNSTATVNVRQGATIQLTTTTSTGIGVTAFHILVDISRTNSFAARTDANNLTVNGNYSTGIQDDNDNTDTAIQLGAFNSAGFDNGDIAEVLLYGKSLTRAETNNIISYVNGRYGTTVSAHNEATQLVFDGDSITAGKLGVPPFAMLTANHEAVFATNAGSQGAYMLDLKNQAATIVDPLLLPNVNNFISVFAGTNDIELGARTAAQVYADFQTYCAARHAVGNNKVIVVDMLPRSVGSEAARTTLNADFDADTCADAHVKTTCNTPMWAAGANTNATWYNADAIHPNTNGHSIIAACLETAIESIPTVAYVPRSH